jgi:hypothetical protein
VTCTVRGSTKPVVTCRVRRVSSSASARLRWRLIRYGHTVAHGTLRTRDGRASLRLSQLAKLRAGRHVLHVDGRRAAAFVLH